MNDSFEEGKSLTIGLLQKENFENLDEFPNLMCNDFKREVEDNLHKKVI